MTRRKPEPSSLSPCIYQADPDAPADHRGDQPCVCHLPKAHPRHTLPDVPEQAEHHRRAGEPQES